MKDVMKKAMTDLNANDQVSSEAEFSCAKYDTPLAHNLTYLLSRVVERPTCRYTRDLLRRAREEDARPCSC